MLNIILILFVIMLLILLSYFVEFLLLDIIKYRRYGGNKITVFLKFIIRALLTFGSITLGVMWLSEPKPEPVKDPFAVKIEHYRKIRSHFILPYDYQYGDLLIPQGSLINRTGKHYEEEDNRPMRMFDIKSVRFPYPVKIAGIKASAFQMYPLSIELAEDKEIGPLYRINQKHQNDPTKEKILCKKGAVARFEKPRLAEENHQMIDRLFFHEKSFRFSPDEWLFLGCNSDGPIEVPLPYYGKLEGKKSKGEN